MSIQSIRRTAFALAAALVVGQFAFATAAEAARRPHCSSVPVPGQPGTFIVVCSTARP